MKNAMIGLFSIVILLLAGFAINTAEGKTLRQNELDSTLSSSMKKSMEILTMKKDYTIMEQKEFVADFIQNAMVKMNSKSKYDIEVYTVDIEKGILDAGVTETYQQFAVPGKVTARRTIVLDNYQNKNNEYFTVTFQDAEGKTIKQLNVHGGDSLSVNLLPAEYKTYKFICVQTGMEYQGNDFNNIRVVRNLIFKLGDSEQAEKGTYIVSYHANGGNGMMQDTQIKIGVSTQLTKNAYIRNGYVFKGWNTKKDGTGTSYSDEQYVTNLTTDGQTIILYAQWDKHNSNVGTYTVYYIANGGSGTMETSVFSFGVNEQLRKNTFSKEGYKFIGWTTNPNGSGKFYKDEEIVNDLSSSNSITNVYLYAQWEKTEIKNSYNIHFHSNGGTGFMADYSAPIASWFYLPANTYTRLNYKFVGWNTRKDGTGIMYKDKEYVEDLGVSPGGSITLYAQWSLLQD